MALIFSGRLFHKVGAAFRKDLSPYVLVRVLGTIKSDFVADLSCRRGWCFSTSSHRYDGDVPCRDLKVYSRTLYCSLNMTGSQWRSTRTGVMWSYLRVLDIITILSESQI